MSDDPTRWLEQSGLDPDVRRAVAAGKQEQPSPAQLDALAARLGPLLGPGGESGGDPGSGGGDANLSPPEGAGPGAEATGVGSGGSALGSAAAGQGATTVGVSLAAKAMGGLMLAVVATGVGLSLVVPDRTVTPVLDAPVPAPATSVPETSTTPAPVIPRGLEVPETIPEAPLPEVLEPAVRVPAVPVPAAPVPSVPRSPRPSPAPPAAPDPAAELALIREAQSALASRPDEALRRTETHRTRFGGGSLAQEREVVAIDALVRLGRTDEARARAERFRQRWPRSAHRRRVDVLTGR